MGYKFWEEKSNGSPPRYSRLPQLEQGDAKKPSTSREASNSSNLFSLIRLLLYSITGIAFIISFLWAGPAALRSYLNAPYPSSSGSSTSPTFTNCSAPDINLIIASSSTQNDDSNAWTKDIKKDNLAVVEYNTPASSPKGSEALIYLNHIYETYDDLPSVSIFTNDFGSRDSTFPLPEPELVTHFDLSAVQSRGFFPFCFQDPFSSEKNDSHTSMFQSFSFRKNFPNKEMPQRFTDPCSKFAVSRDAIRSVPREQYLHHATLLRKACANSGAGKKWDVMWQYLFLNGDLREVAPSESLCQGWGFCFSEEEWVNFKELWNEMEMMRGGLEKMKQVGKTYDVSEETRELELEMERLKLRIENARNLSVRD